MTAYDGSSFHAEKGGRGESGFVKRHHVKTECRKRDEPKKGRELKGNQIIGANKNSLGRLIKA